MPELFDNPLHEPFQPPPAAGQTAPTVGVVVNANLWRTFDYLWPEHLGQPQVGQRVRVPFGRGNRKTLAFVVDTPFGATPNRSSVGGEADKTNTPKQTALGGGTSGAAFQMKEVVEVVDPHPQLDEPLYKLGQWISHYYMTPLGMTLAAMIPSAVGRRGPREEAVAFLTSHHADWPKSLGPHQKAALDELYEARKQGVEPLTLENLTTHSGCSRDSVKRLAGRGLIRLETRPVQLPQIAQEANGDPFELGAEQRAALDTLAVPLAGGFSVTLLHGVTGSGKTEIYVRAIRQVVQQGKQAILLVPEIALATQTLQRLLGRLPKVAVLHSGLTEVQRAFYYEKIRDGEAAVVVGPRSAIFAPTRKLGLIIVDEEHEPSYKQDTAPRYHGRDVAVMRGSLCGVPVILGSATPSLESLANAQAGRYKLLRLTRRVRNLPMPRLSIVALRKELTPGRIELIGRTLTLAIAAAIDRREQVILLMNRRGYASFVFCPKCDWRMTCDHCTRAMVFHQATQLAMCHYCQSTAALPEVCPACKGKLLLFGYGIQRIEGELARKFPTARVARMDSDTMTTPRQFQKVFDEFGRGELDILLGTQMVAKGLDFPRVSLVGVVSADTSLNLPDFRAAERTFQLVVQVAGRAGRDQVPGEVVVQTLNEDEPAIVHAVSHDYDGFAANELPLRREANLPPFSRLVRLIVRHEDFNKTQRDAELAGRRLSGTLPASISMMGPMPAGVQRIRNLFRFQILLTSQRPGAIQQVLSPRMDELCKGLDAEIIADVDPMNLL